MLHSIQYNFFSDTFRYKHDQKNAWDIGREFDGNDLVQHKVTRSLAAGSRPMSHACLLVMFISEAVGNNKIEKLLSALS